MIVHQHVRMQHHLEPVYQLGQQLAEVLVVTRVPKNRAPFISRAVM
jgi:hypothetical protein